MEPRPDAITSRLMEIFTRLLDFFGPQRWWPGDTPFEVMVGAILTQNTAWLNVEKAISNLKARHLLDPASLNALPVEELAGLIKPAGYFNLKARRLKNMVALVIKSGGGDPPLLLTQAPSLLKEELLSVNGIGQETADSILLYAAGYRVFVIDAYTRRVLSRHGFVEADEPYENLQNIFMNNLPADTALFNEYHALLVRLGKQYCRPRPDCAACPLKGLNRQSIKS